MPLERSSRITGKYLHEQEPDRHSDHKVQRNVPEPKRAVANRPVERDDHRQRKDDRLPIETSDQETEIILPSLFSVPQHKTRKEQCNARKVRRIMRKR